MGRALNSNFQFSKGTEGAVLGNIKQREKSLGKPSVNFDVANCQFGSEILYTGWSYVPSLPECSLLYRILYSNTWPGLL